MLVSCHFQISKTNISLDVSETLVKRFTSKKDFHGFSEHHLSFYWKTTHVQSTYSKNISSCICVVLINYYALVNELNSKSSVEEKNFHSADGFLLSLLWCQKFIFPGKTVFTSCFRQQQPQCTMQIRPDHLVLEEKVQISTFCISSCFSFSSLDFFCCFETAWLFLPSENKSWHHHLNWIWVSDGFLTERINTAASSTPRWAIH